MRHEAIEDEAGEILKRGEALGWEDAMEQAMQHQLGAKAKITPPPVAHPLVAEVLRVDHELGRDQNGSTLHAERRSYLDEVGVEGEARPLCLELLSVANQVRADILSEKLGEKK